MCHKGLIRFDIIGAHRGKIYELMFDNGCDDGYKSVLLLVDHAIQKFSFPLLKN
jgi:hypothetical protein